jgi:hypothetical protein
VLTSLLFSGSAAALCLRCCLQEKMPTMAQLLAMLAKYVTGLRSMPQPPLSPPASPMAQPLDNAAQQPQELESAAADSSCEQQQQLGPAPAPL